MTFTEAAVEVLRAIGRPLHYKKITEIAIDRNLLSHVGKTPEVTMSSRLATLVKSDRGDAPIVKVRPGIFGLREFSAEALANVDPDEAMDASDLEESEQSKAVSAEAVDSPEAEKEEAAPESVERLPSGEVPAEVAEVSSLEDDDDEPIFQRERKDEGLDSESRMRRRRRRRRRGGRAEAGPGDLEGAPSARAERHDVVSDSEEEAPEDDGHDLTGKDLADAVYAILFVERQTASFRRLAEQLVRRKRLAGEPAALAPTVAASVRADIAVRETTRQPPRFRLAAGRVGLCEWWKSQEALRAYETAMRAAETHRDAVRRSFLRAVSELPTPGFVELVATWLNAEGVSALRAVRRPGISSHDFHLAGILKKAGSDLRLAVVIRRDGRDLTREVVVETRGTLHHYGNADVAWLVTTGDVLSGARDEAAQGTTPMQLLDGASLAKAMERVGVGFRLYTLPISEMDMDLLESLKGHELSMEGQRSRGDYSRGDLDRNGRSGSHRNSRRGSGGRFDKRGRDENRRHEPRENYESSRAASSNEVESSNNVAEAILNVLDDAPESERYREPQVERELDSGTIDDSDITVVLNRAGQRAQESEGSSDIERSSAKESESRREESREETGAEEHSVS